MLHSWSTLVVKLVGSRITLEITSRHTSKIELMEVGRATVNVPAPFPCLGQIELTEVGRATVNVDGPFPLLGAVGGRKLSATSKSFRSLTG